MSEKIKKEMLLGEVIEKHPETAQVMLKKGLHCAGCGIARFESIEQGARAHGLTEKQVEELVKEMNEKIKEEN